MSATIRGLPGFLNRFRRTRQWNQCHGLFWDTTNGVKVPWELGLEVFDRLCLDALKGHRSANGAFFYHVDGSYGTSIAASASPLLERGKFYGFQNAVRLTPFGYGGNPQGTAGLAAAYINDFMPAQVAAYLQHDPVFIFGNKNAATWAGTDAEFFAAEGAALKKIQDLGGRTAISDDSGLTFLCFHIVARRDAWIAAGVNLDLIEYAGGHGYVAAGDFPVHLLHARDAFARVSIPLDIVMDERAYDFLRSGEGRGQRPDIFSGKGPQWMKWLYGWHARFEAPMVFFSFPVFYGADPTTSSEPYNALGKDWQSFGRALRTFDYPTPAEALAQTPPAAVNDGAAKAYNLVYNNQPSLSVPEKTALATAAAQRVVDGYLFQK